MLSVRLVRIVLALLTLLGGPALADDTAFSGIVTWRERMVLPSDAALTVTLVALPGQRHIAGAHAELGDKAGSPVQFTLNVRSDAIDEDARLGLMAEIRSRGYVIFRNALPVPVDPAEPSGNVVELQFSPPPPHDPPDQVSPPVEVPNPLLGALWTLTSIGGDPVLPGTVITFSIASDHRAGGNGGCNNYFTEASFDDPPLSFGPVAGTRKACADLVMTQETRFFAALGATHGYELAGDALKLVDAAGVTLAGLIRQP